MRNLRMAEMVANGVAVDVSQCRRTADGGYILNGFDPDLDYCDVVAEEWIWAIVRSVETGLYIALTATSMDRCVGNPDYMVMWLR